LKRSESSAFTIIEILVVLVIVSLLAGLIVVGLSRMKNRAQEVQNLVNLRSHASTWSSYSNDYKDVFPYFVAPEPGWIDVTRDDGSSVRIKYLQQRTEWPVLMSKSYYSGLSSLAPVFHPPWTISTYNSPCAFRVDPDHYTAKRVPFPSQLRAIFAHEVSIPSRKAFFSSDSIASENVRDFDSGSGWGGGYLYASFCDGSARKVDVTSIINWQTNGDFAPGQGPEWNDCPPYAKYTPLHHTRDGVRSPDVK
jgi:prepilin-type N-terminal cleavage/methylation domain-containing protein